MHPHVAGTIALATIEIEHLATQLARIAQTLREIIESHHHAAHAPPTTDAPQRKAYEAS